MTTPVGGGFRSINVPLREELGLYANVRPVRSMVHGGRFDDIDIVLVQENLGDLYVAFELYIPIGDDPHATGPGCIEPDDGRHLCAARRHADNHVMRFSKVERSTARPTFQRFGNMSLLGSFQVTIGFVCRN